MPDVSHLSGVNNCCARDAIVLRQNTFRTGIHRQVTIMKN